MIASILRAAGLRVGLFTSPHLVRYNERIVVDGRPISDSDLDAPRVSWRHRCGPPPRRPAWASHGVRSGHGRRRGVLRRAGVDVAVVEVGLGGRWDSTNVVRSAVSVITPIGLDHTNRLGTTVAEIAGDKAGIIRSGVPVVSARQLSEAAQVIAGEAEARGAPLLMAGRDFDVRLREAGKGGTAFDVRWRRRWLRELARAAAGSPPGGERGDGGGRLSDAA